MEEENVPLPEELPGGEILWQEGLKEGQLAAKGYALIRARDLNILRETRTRRVNAGGKHFGCGKTGGNFYGNRIESDERLLFDLAGDGR